MAGETQAPVALATAPETLAPEASPAKPSPPEPCVPKRADEDQRKDEAGVVAEHKEAMIPQSASFKEESNVVADLTEPQRKELDKLKELVAAALANNEFTRPPPPPSVKQEEKKEPDKKEEEGALVVGEGDKSEETSKDPTKPQSLTEPSEQAKEEKPAPEAVTKGEEKVDGGAKPVEPNKETVVAASEVVKEDKTPLIAEEDNKEDKVVQAVDQEKKTMKLSEVMVEEDKMVPKVSDVVVEEDKKIPKVVEEVVVEQEKKKPEETDGGTAEDEANLPPPPPEQVFLWGVPLHDSDKSDTILLKFLRARDYKAKQALPMIKNTVFWRKDFGIEALLAEDLGVQELEKAVFMHGVGKEGHPVCYNMLGAFQDKEMYHKTLVDEKGSVFMRWRVQFMEKGIREMLDFSPEGICTMVQVFDFKNAPWLWKTELWHATNETLRIFQENYPEFSVKQIFINVPWWYIPPNRVIAAFTQRTKSKFVFAGPSKSAETLFKYIAPEQVPVQYGGLSMDDDSEFCTADAATVVSIKPSSNLPIEIPVTETCCLVWELRVLGWDVKYGGEFVPSEEGGYTVIIHKTRKLLASTDEAVVRDSFKISQPGKVILTIDNATSKKKKVLYRYKTKSSTD